MSGQHERGVLKGQSKGCSLSSAVICPFESRRRIGCAFADRLSFGHPTAEIFYVGRISTSLYQFVGSISGPRKKERPKKEDYRFCADYRR